MHLYGMLDSPFVRRVAISMKFLGLSYQHTKWSVFRDAAEFGAINPLLKAPTFVADDGTVLVESAMILEYLEKLAPPEKSLLPADLPQLLKSQRFLGVALIACEKIIQLMLETRMRPEEARSEMFEQRFMQQVSSAFSALEADLPGTDDWLVADRPMQADITVAVTWGFGQIVFPDLLTKANYPKLAVFSAKAEALPEFLSTSPFEG